MNRRGRPVLAALSGFFTGLFLALDLVFFGVIRLDNVSVTVLPCVGLVAGTLLALWAPLGRAAAGDPEVGGSGVSYTRSQHGGGVGGPQR
jgi:hypothetical protein